jgi:hypothetical protein
METFDAIEQDNFFKLGQSFYYLGNFKLCCDISNDINIFDLYYLGYPIGPINIKIPKFFLETFKKASEQRKSCLIKIPITKNIEKYNPFSFSHHETVGEIIFQNKKADSEFEPVFIELNEQGVKHLIQPRKVLFEKTIKEPVPFKQEYFFGIDPATFNLQQSFFRLERKKEQNTNTIIDYIQKLR